MYLRKSRAEENAPVSETLARHREALAAHAAAHKITVAAVYEEVASGDSLYSRPEMLRLLSEADKYDAVLCMDIDRLGRGAMHEQGLILDALKAAGVLIVTPGKTYDLANDMDDSLISFKALFAREEYKMIRGRLRRGVMKTVHDGGYVANAPFGYVKVRVDKRPTLDIDEHEAVAVRMIFDMYCSGTGCPGIADTINALGYRPRRSDKFNRTTVRKIIGNPVYIGKIAWNQYSFKRPKKDGEKHRRTLNPQSEWIIADGKHPPIIEKETFDRANEILTGRYHPPFNKPDEVKNPLSGILYCGNCGYVMVRMPYDKRPGQHPAILCNTKGCCMGSYQHIVEQILYHQLTFMAAEMRVHDPAHSTMLHENRDAAISTANAEIARLNSQIEKLHDLLEREVYDIDTFLARRDDLRSRIDAAQTVIRNADRIPDPVVIQARLHSVIQGYWDGEPIDRNRMLRSVIGRAEYFKPKGSGWGSMPEIRVVQWR
jgi:DNA invertase Pin-like site-specific DNA recombinase